MKYEHYPQYPHAQTMRWWCLVLVLFTDGIATVSAYSSGMRTVGCGAAEVGRI